MNLQTKIVTSTAVAAISIVGLAGCAHKSDAPTAPLYNTNATNNSSASNTANSVGTTNGSANDATGNTLSSNSAQSSSSFPDIVRNAMSQVPTNSRSGAQAPTTLPKSANGDDTLQYTVTHSTQPGTGVTNYQSTYNVSLGNSHQSLANWNVTHYASADMAKQAYQSTMGAGTPAFSGDPAITLTGNHTAYVTKDGNGATSIRWTEGKWNIRVTALKTEVAPTPVADQVAAYLDKNLMPAPHDVGAINVTSSDMSNSHLQAQVFWQENENLYQVQTTEYTSDPVQTALGMAISMKPYQG